MKKVYVFSGDGVATARSHASCRPGERKALLVFIATYGSEPNFTNATTTATEEGWEHVVIDTVEVMNADKLGAHKDLLRAYEEALERGRAILPLDTGHF